MLNGSAQRFTVQHDVNWKIAENRSERIDGDRNPPSSPSILSTEVYPTGRLAGPARRSHGFLAVSKAAISLVWGFALDRWNFC